ncbi:MAG: hypothetical protein DWQ04_14320 [Chloroflexi bacterium]|nr:MAG: hypothetical protein DWQ04_14320 [Chloroflexota bacterium]
MKRTVWFLLVVTAVFLIGRPAVQSAHDKTTSQSSLNMEEDGMLVHWQVPVPQFSVEEQVSYVEIPDYLMTEEPGEYLLPVDAKLIAVPDGAQPTVEVISLKQSSYPLMHAPAIAPMPAGVITDADGQVIGGDFQPVTNANPQASALVSLDEVGIMRGVRLMRLTLIPVRPQQGAYLVAEQVSVRVRFNQPERSALLGDSLQMANTAVSDTLLKTVQSMVVNPQQVSGFQSKPAASLLSRIQTETTSSPTVAIEVSEVGITAVTYADLAATGFPVGSANPQNLHLKHDGVEVPIEWIGDADDTFEANEQFFFYAAPRFSRWFNGDIYLLTADNLTGDRISTQSAFPDGLIGGQVLLDTTIELNDLYMPDANFGSMPPGRDGDRFVWDFFKSQGIAERDYSISLTTVDTSVDAELTLWFIGFTNPSQAPDHQVNVTWNGADVGSVIWEGKTAVTSTLTIPSANLQPTNLMTLTLVDPPGVTINGVWFDAAQVRYSQNDAQIGNALQFTGEATQHKYSVGLANTIDLRIYDVTNPDSPIKLGEEEIIDGKTVLFGDPSNGPHNYALANLTGIISPDNIRLLRTLQTENTTGANYIVISPDAFMPALNSLVVLRQSQGLQVVVEDVQAIYDQYGGGFPVPDAIHDYLANTYANWNPIPEYVLLVGDATFDPKQYRADSIKTWVAPFLLEADPWIGEVPVDNRFVTFDGGNTDTLPDMMIGRLPVNSLSETQTVVNKIVQYETNPEFGPWNGRIPFVADKGDDAGDFAAHSNTLISKFVHSPWTEQTWYLNVTQDSAEELHDSLLNTWNQGSGIIVYSGHSSQFQWSGIPVLHVDDVASLNNGARLPIVLEMTCLTGSYHIPDLVTLDEELIRSETGGAVAVWGSTGFGVATGHQELASGFFQTLLIDGNPVIGQAVLAGKLNLRNFHRDLLDTFTLLGDPYLHLNQEIPENQLYLPAVNR